jgi:hypothetical protein
MFKIGQKVICVKSFEKLRTIWGFNYPKINDIVEVLSIKKHHTINDYLITIPNLECEVCAHCFKPLKYISAANELIEKFPDVKEISDKPIKC